MSVCVCACVCVRACVCVPVLLCRHSKSARRDPRYFKYYSLHITSHCALASISALVLRLGTLVLKSCWVPEFVLAVTMLPTVIQVKCPIADTSTKDVSSFRAHFSSPQCSQVLFKRTAFSGQILK